MDSEQKEPSGTKTEVPKDDPNAITAFGITRARAIELEKLSKDVIKAQMAKNDRSISGYIKAVLGQNIIKTVEEAAFVFFNLGMSEGEGIAMNNLAQIMGLVSSLNRKEKPHGKENPDSRPAETH